MKKGNWSGNVLRYVTSNEKRINEKNINDKNINEIVTLKVTLEVE